MQRVHPQKARRSGTSPGMPVPGGGLTDMSVLVSTPPSLAHRQRFLVDTVDAFDAMARWRYLTRVRGHIDDTVLGPAETTMPKGGATVQPEMFDIVIGLIRGDPPTALARADRQQIERWQTAGPWLILVEEPDVPQPRDAETLRYYQMVQSLVDWAASLPRVVVVHRGQNDELADVVSQALAGVVRQAWLAQHQLDRLVCPKCKREHPLEPNQAWCDHHRIPMVWPQMLGVRRAPRYIGRYPIHGQLGRGGFGRVWLTTTAHREWGALKTLITADDEDAASRLRREFELLSDLQHPNIIRLLEQDEVDGVPVGVLEYLPGRLLSFVLSALPPRQVLGLMVDLLSALSAVHGKGIIHRDLKPNNIMLVDDPLRAADLPRLVLFDFGLGKHWQNDKEGLTQSGMLMGTFRYMAPEQFDRQAPVDERADLYAVGVMLYMALSLEKKSPNNPPEHPNDPVAMVEFMQRVQTEDPEPIRRRDVPPGVLDIVMTALARDPDVRFSSAIEMMKALVDELARWDDTTIDLRDDSWARWSPSQSYLRYHRPRSSGTRAVDAGPWTTARPDEPIGDVAGGGGVRQPGHTAVLQDPRSENGEPPQAVPGVDRARTGWTKPPPIQWPHADGHLSRGNSAPMPQVVGRSTAPPALGAHQPALPNGTFIVPEPIRPAAEPPQSKRSWLVAGVILLGCTIGGLAWWVSWPPPVRVVVMVTFDGGRPASGVRVEPSSGGGGTLTDESGRADLRLGVADQGPWELKIDPPAGLDVRGGPRRRVEQSAVDSNGTVHLKIALFNPFAIQNPGGALIPVDLGEGYVRLLRPARFSALLPAEEAGVLELPAGTALYTCGAEHFAPEGVESDPKRLKSILERCVDRARDGEIALRLKRPEMASPAVKTFSVVR